MNIILPKLPKYKNRTNYGEKMKSGIFGLIDPKSDEIRYVSSTEDLENAPKKYKGDLRKRVGSPEVYRWLCELRLQGLNVEHQILEECEISKISETKAKWICRLQEHGEAEFNVNLT